MPTHEVARFDLKVKNGPTMVKLQFSDCLFAVSGKSRRSRNTVTNRSAVNLIDVMQQPIAFVNTIQSRPLIFHQIKMSKKKKRKKKNHNML